jgi:hypothetical protein
MARLQSVEKYKDMGLVQLATWVTPETLKKIKTLAFLQDKTIRDVITERFSDVQVDTGKGRLTVRFRRDLEVQD